MRKLLLGPLKGLSGTVALERTCANWPASERLDVVACGSRDNVGPSVGLVTFRDAGSRTSDIFMTASVLTLRSTVGAAEPESLVVVRLDLRMEPFHALRIDFVYDKRETCWWEKLPGFTRNSTRSPSPMFRGIAQPRVSHSRL